MLLQNFNATGSRLRILSQNYEPLTAPLETRQQRWLGLGLGQALGYHGLFRSHVGVPNGAGLLDALVPRLRALVVIQRRRRGARMQLLRSQSTHPLPFKLVSSDDHVTPMSGLAGSVTVTLSKDGGAFAAPSGAISEIGSTGHYKVAGNATDCNTLGTLKIRATAAGCDEFEDVFQVVAYDPDNANHLGLAGLKPTSEVGKVTNIISPAASAFFATTLANTTDHIYSGRDIFWASGALAGHTTRVIRCTWNGGLAAHYLEVCPPLPTAPSNLDEFIILPQRSFSPEIVLATTIATAPTQLTIDLTDGHTENDAYNGCVAIFYSASTGLEIGVSVITDYDAGSKRITLAYTTGTSSFLLDSGVYVFIVADRSVKPTTRNELLDVQKLNAQLGSAVYGTVSGVGTPAANAFNGGSATEKGTTLSSSDDYYNGGWLVFGGTISGSLRGLARRITNYVGATRTFEFSGASPDDADYQFPAAPGGGAEFMIIGHAGVVS